MPGQTRALSPSSRRREARIHWSALVFLILFTIGAMWIAYYAMKPAAEVAQTASDAEKHRIVAWFRLLLAVLLFILFAGVVLTFRFGRLFFPRTGGPRVKTQYVDAWAESGKRLRVTPDDADDERGSAMARFCDSSPMNAKFSGRTTSSAPARDARSISAAARARLSATSSWLES
jgi:hypothetical protein